MSDHRRMVPSETPSACAACDVDRPSGLPLMFLMNHIGAPDREGCAALCSNCTTSGQEGHREPRDLPKFCLLPAFRPTPVRIPSWQDRGDDAAAPPPPPRRRPSRLPGDRHRPGARAAALAWSLAPGVGADRRAAVGALARRSARSAAARRLRGPSPPPVLAGVAGRRDRRVLPRGRRGALHASPVTTSGPSSRCLRCRRCAGARAAGRDAQPAAPP